MGAYNVQTITLTNGDEIRSALASNLGAQGWSLAGTTYTRTIGGRTMTVDIPAIDWRSNVGYITINGQAAYFPVHLLTSGLNVQVMYAIDNDFMYFRVQGPDPGSVGAVDAVYGSPRAFAMITTINPADSGDTNADSLQVAIRSHTATNYNFGTTSVIQKYGPSGAANQPAELMTSRPAIQDIASLGDLPPSIKAGSGYFGSRFAVVDSTYGLRGTLNNVAFASENYVLAGDSTNQKYPVNTEYVRAGVRYVTDVPCGYPNNAGSINYSPFGLCLAGSNAVQNFISQPSGCGPVIFIKRGDGL